MTHPLSDVIVLDLTHVLAGPYATMMLGEMGAEIIKVERPGTGDDTRAFAPFIDGKSAYFATVNRGKRSIALDLKAPEDRALFERLLDEADILVENFRPGAMERLGYGYDDLQKSHPRLIYGAVSGYSHTGPWAEKPAYDMVVLAMGGVMSITGEAGREPVRCGASIGDIVAGMFLTQGLLAALHERGRTGRGRKVDVAMLDSQLAIIEHAIAITKATGTPPGPTGARHPSVAPFETYHTADGLMVIAAGNDKIIRAAVEALGLGEMADDPLFADNAARVSNAKLMKRRLETVLLTEPRATWIARLEATGVPCGPIQNVAEAMAHRQIRARDMVVGLGAPADEADFVAAGNPVKFSDVEDDGVRPPAPGLDEHRAEILAWLDQRAAA